MWCVAELNEEYVRKLEDVLELYERPYNPAEPVVCLDEKPVTLLPLETRLSLGQSAHLLGASPEEMRKLLETGHLPFTEGALGPQIRYADLRDYQERRKKEREQILRELMEETERLGLYEPQK